MDWAKTTARRDEKRLCLGIGWVLYKIIDDTLQITSYESLSDLGVVGWRVAPVYPDYWGLAFRWLFEDKYVVKSFL